MTSFKQSAETLLNLVRQGGYNDCLVDIDLNDKGFDRYKDYLDVDVALEQLEALATKERHQAQLDLLEDLHDCKDIIKSEYERRTKILKELLDV